MLTYHWCQCCPARRKPPWPCRSPRQVHTACCGSCQTPRCCRRWHPGLRRIYQSGHPGSGSIYVSKRSRNKKGPAGRTPLLPLGSMEVAHALVLIAVSQPTNPRKHTQRIAYTKGSLTEMTKTWPASLSLGWLMYPGTWELEQAGPMHG